MKLADIARSAYVRSPGWLRRATSPLLSLVPAQVRLGGQYREWQAIISKTETNPEFARDFQIARLRRVLASCAERSSYYRPLLPSAETIAAADADTLTAIFDALPILEKSTVREHGREMLIRPENAVDEVSTSGSSGEPLSFFLDKDRSVREWAFVTHIWRRSGFNKNSTRAVLRGTQLPKHGDIPWEWDPALRELRFSPFHLKENVMDEYIALMDRYKVAFLHGYPSAIETFGSHVMRRNWAGRDSILGVLPISESLFEHQRELISYAFPRAVVAPFYGMSEKVAIAGETPDQVGVYEFEPAYGIAELVDETGQRITTPGHKGRIVGTGFISTSMPLLRYFTGDEAVLVRPAAYDNCQRLLLSGVSSRWSQEFLIGRNGEKISMTAINIHSSSYSHVSAFQFYQDTPGFATIKIRKSPTGSDAEIQSLVSQLQQKLKDSINLTPSLNGEFAVNIRGKRPFIDQQIEYM